MTMLTGSLFVDLVALFVTVAALVYSYFVWSYQYWKRRNLHYLEPKIPFGNLQNPLTSKISVADNVLNIYNEAKSKGWKHCGLFAVTIPVYMVLDLDLLKHIMTKDFNHFVDRGMYINEKDDPLSTHLFALGGKKWKNLRAKLSPTFTSGKMKMMFQTMVDSGEILEKYIQDDVAGKQVIDVKDVLGRFSTDIIGNCAFGLECNSFKEPNNPFRVYGKKVLDISALNLAIEFFATSFQSVAKSLGIRVFDKDCIEFYSKVVNDVISYREKNNVTRNDFMQLLMEMKGKGDAATGDGNTLSMTEIIAQSFVFFIGGFETSSTTMTFALFELSRHQDVQDKVTEEIRTVLARHDNKMSYESVNEMVYMKQVIDETLRLYPPLPLLTRECVEDYKVPGENFVIEKGTSIFIPIIGLHYDKDYYEDPKKFDPERFSVEKKKSRNQYAHIPFGEGPRVCIGERFGILQTKVGLTSVLKNFKITLNEKTKVPLKWDPKARITSAEGGIWLNVEKI